MHICGYFEITKRVIPALTALSHLSRNYKKGKGLQKLVVLTYKMPFIMVDQEISAFVDGLKLQNYARSKR